MTLVLSVGTQAMAAGTLTMQVLCGTRPSRSAVYFVFASESFTLKHLRWSAMGCACALIASRRLSVT